MTVQHDPVPLQTAAQQTLDDVRVQFWSLGAKTVDAVDVIKIQSDVATRAHCGRSELPTKFRDLLKGKDGVRKNSVSLYELMMSLKDIAQLTA